MISLRLLGVGWAAGIRAKLENSSTRVFSSSTDLMIIPVHSSKTFSSRAGRTMF
jgi:hypothetical protein